MQVQKIDLVNFKARGIRVPYNFTKPAFNPKTTKIVGLAGLAASGIASTKLSEVKEKSYERTLLENYFQLPEGATPDVFQKASAAYLYNENDNKLSVQLSPLLLTPNQIIIRLHIN